MQHGLALLLVALLALATAQPPQPAQYICFSLPATWCNQFNLTLDKYDSVGNGYYYGVDSSCFDDAPEDVMYGMFYQATGTYVVNFYWNMTSSVLGQSTVVFHQDVTGNWVNAITWANRVDLMEEAVEGPDYYLTPRAVQLAKC